MKQESQTASVLKDFREACEPSVMSNISGLMTTLPLQGRKEFSAGLLNRGVEN